MEARMRRIKELYEWGDITKEEYLKEKERIQQEIGMYVPFENPAKDLERLAGFLTSITKAREEANQEHRNKLARCLFQEVWVKDKQVAAVKPQPELALFFKLNYEEFVNKSLKTRPRGDLNP